jgi:LppX/LprAFG-like lipoprotein
MNRTRVAALAGALLVVAGCSTTTKGTGIGPAYTSVAGLGAALAHANAQLKSEQGSLHLSAGPIDETGTFSGKLDGGNVVELEARYTTTLQGNTTRLHMIIVGGTLYVERGQNGKPWVIATPDSPDPIVAELAKDISGTLTQSGVRQFVLMVAAAQNLKLVGQETVDGVSCMHYSLSVDTRSAAQKLPGTQGQQMQQAADAGVDTIPLNLWVDGQGLVRKVTDKVTTEQATAALELRLNRFDEDVHISAPPPSQIGSG